MVRPYMVVVGWEETRKLEFVRRLDASGDGRKRFLAALAAEPHLLKPLVVRTTDCGLLTVELTGAGKRWFVRTPWVGGATGGDPSNDRRYAILQSAMGHFENEKPFVLLPQPIVSPIELRDASIKASQSR